MADKKISELTAITAANTAADDVFAVVDTSSTETKKISRDELKTAVAQSGAEIKTAYEAEANAFTDAQFTKLTNIEELADVTDTANVTAAGALMDSEVANLAQVKAFDSADYATAAQGTTADAALANVVEDVTPQLGGSLDVNGQDIVSTSNGDIDLDPNGSGKVVFKGNATKGSGQFVLNCEQNTHGIVIKGPPHSAAASYTLTLPNTDGSANEFLQTDGSGNLSWVAQSGGGGGISNVVEDTTPQLGGDLQSNGNDIVFADDDQAIFGAGSDLTIKSDGSNAIIQAAGTTYVRGGTLIFSANGGAGGYETGIRVNEVSSETSQVELYYDNSLKLETVASGVTVTGTLAATAVTGDGSGLTNLPSGGGGGAHTLISTTNVTTAVAQVDISLSGTYEKYVLTFLNVNASGDPDEALRLRVSDDGGSTFKTSSFYTDKGIGLYSLANNTRGQTNPSSFGTGTDSFRIFDGSAQTYGVRHGEIHIYDPHNSSNDWSAYCLWVGQSDSAGGGVAAGWNVSSYYVAADYNAIRLYFNGDNMTSGEFKLFGVS